MTKTMAADGGERTWQVAAEQTWSQKTEAEKPRNVVEEDPRLDYVS